MNIYWLEIKRFLKENKKSLVIWTLGLGILLSGVLIFLGQRSTEEEIETEIEDSREVFENKSRAAFFRFYIENPDGYSFNNSSLIDDLFNMEDLYEEVLAETGVDIQKIKDLAEEKEVTDFSPIKVRINTDSHIFTAIFETGNNQDNMNLAEFYYDYLFSEQIPLFEGHKIFSLVEPELAEDIEEKEEAVKAIQAQRSKANLVKAVGTNLMVGFILAGVMALGLALLKALFGKKLSYVFGYNAEDFGDFMVYDSQLDNQAAIQYFASIPSSAKRLVLTETELSAADKKIVVTNAETNANTEWSRSIETTSTANLYDEIVLLIKANETTRSWFDKQKKLIGLHHAQTKLIQLNHDVTTKDQSRG